METRFNVTGTERKALVKAIENIIQETAVYKKAPTFEYTVGNFTIDKNGTVSCDDGDALERLTHNLIADGFSPEETSAAEPAAEAGTPELVSLTVEVPMTNHTGSSIRNLINLVYTRADLLNKALGTSFRVDAGLTQALKDEASILTKESLLAAIAAYEDEYGKAIDGLTITQERITFGNLPETNDAEVLRTFTILCGMMNKQALDQKRIQAKTVNEENEKYALRIWLTRLGMNGPEYKEARRILMANLTGHSAFRTEAEKERWLQRQAEKREAQKTSEEVTEQ